MIILSLYALVVWWIAAHNRRRWQGFAAAAAGAAFVLPLLDPLVYLVWWMMGEQPTWLFPFMYAYAAVLVAVGLFLASLPRAAADTQCAACGYDLAGITAELCPECGAALNRRPSPRAEPARRTR